MKTKYIELTEKNATDIRDSWTSGESTQKQLAKSYGVTIATINNILLNKRHKNKYYDVADANKKRKNAVAVKEALDDIRERKSYAEQKEKSNKDEISFLRQIEITLNKGEK